jgi:hypothetical protein
LTINAIVIIVGSLGFALAASSLITGALNKKRYKEICKLYKEKFGDLPPMVQIFDDVNTLYVDFAYSVKMQFIFKPLLWNKSSNMTKNDDKDFIRGLPTADWSFLRRDISGRREPYLLYHWRIVNAGY